MNRHTETVIRSVAWGAVIYGTCGAALTWYEGVTGLASIAFTLGAALVGAMVGFAFGATVAHLDRRDEIKADATARQMAQMFERQDDTKRRAA